MKARIETIKNNNIIERHLSSYEVILKYKEGLLSLDLHRETIDATGIKIQRQLFVIPVRNEPTVSFLIPRVRAPWCPVRDSESDLIDR